MSEQAITLPVTDAFVEAVAERVAQILAERIPVADVADPGFLDVPGAAEFLACPKSRIYSLVSAGVLPHHKDGSRLLFDHAELRQFVLDGGAVRA